MQGHIRTLSKTEDLQERHATMYNVKLDSPEEMELFEKLAKSKLCLI